MKFLTFHEFRLKEKIQALKRRRTTFVKATIRIQSSLMKQEDNTKYYMYICFFSVS